MNKIIKRLKSKTYWAAIVGTALTALEVNLQIVVPLIPEPYRPYTVLVWPVLMLALREATKDALGDK